MRNLFCLETGVAVSATPVLFWVNDPLLRRARKGHALPVILDFLRESREIRLVGEILLESGANDRIVIIGQVVIIRDQPIGIREALNRLSQRIGNRKRNIRICGDQGAVIDDKILTRLVVNEPVQEILRGSALFIGDRLSLDRKSVV